VHINNIWCCPKEGCGRRFKAISRNRGYTPGEGYLNTIVWEEQMPALPLSEDEIAALLEGGLEDD
jgi:hypothetical protein